MWTYPLWYILLSFSVPSWTTHHRVKLTDFSISSASILSTYLCPFPKLDCRVNKFNYSMFSIYLNFFFYSSSSSPSLHSSFAWEKSQHVKPIMSTCTQNPSTASPVKILFYVQNSVCFLRPVWAHLPYMLLYQLWTHCFSFKKSSLFLLLDSCTCGFL